MKTKDCAHCGVKHNTTDKYCRNTGKPLADTETCDSVQDVRDRERDEDRKDAILGIDLLNRMRKR